MDKLPMRWMGFWVLALALCSAGFAPTFAAEPAKSTTAPAATTPSATDDAKQTKEGEADSKATTEEEGTNGEEQKNQKKKSAKKVVLKKKPAAAAGKGAAGTSKGFGGGAGSGGSSKFGGAGGMAGSNAGGGAIVPPLGAFPNLTTGPSQGFGAQTTQSTAAGSGGANGTGGKSTTAGSHNSTTTANGTTTGGGSGANAGTTNGTGQAAPAFAQMIQQIVDLTNEQRRTQRLSPLAIDSTLATMAAQHSANMARLNIMAHELEGVTFQQRVEQSGYRAAAAGENVAYGQKSAAEVVTAWMNSPGHRANILNAQFTQIGVGVARNDAGVLYFTQVFGRPR